MSEKIRESAFFIADAFGERPSIAVILGSGLGGFTAETVIEKQAPYNEIPHFPATSVDGHKGVLMLGRIAGIPLLIMQGRMHFYEGHTMEQITFPIRVLNYLGVKTLILSNASGGMNPDFKIGDLMLITDHINMLPNPLIGPHDDEFGPRFPDMSKAYDRNLIKLAKSVANSEGITVKQGCYVGVTGPTYETPAEYRFYRLIGGDAIGMSTIPEVIVARQMNIRCFAISVITDLGVEGKIKYLTHEIVQEEASAAEAKLAKIVKGLIAALPE